MTNAVLKGGAITPSHHHNAAALTPARRSCRDQITRGQSRLLLLPDSQKTAERGAHEGRGSPDNGSVYRKLRF